jgi:type IX secretion system substrate protein
MINIISSDNIAAVSIYNMLGELVYSGNNDHSIKFQPLSEGIYIVKTISKEGKENMVRFVKK